MCPLLLAVPPDSNPLLGYKFVYVLRKAGTSFWIGVERIIPLFAQSYHFFMCVLGILILKEGNKENCFLITLALKSS